MLMLAAHRLTDHGAIYRCAAGSAGALTFTQTRQLVQASAPADPADATRAATSTVNDQQTKVKAAKIDLPAKPNKRRIAGRSSGRVAVSEHGGPVRYTPQTTTARPEPCVGLHQLTWNHSHLRAKL